MAKKEKSWMYGRETRENQRGVAKQWGGFFFSVKVFVTFLINVTTICNGSLNKVDVQ